jgi:hypothetical protein
VVGAQCRSPRTGEGQCGDLGRNCRSVCDCNEGLACRNGQCSVGPPDAPCCTRPASCKDGERCQEADGTFGVCGKQPACQTTCDCPQGADCTNGECIFGFVPVYCCTKAGCPDGEFCKNPDGSQTSCPSAPDCGNDSQCGVARCEDRFGGDEGCFEITPRCVDNVCREDSQKKEGVCDPKIGQCIAGQKCATVADCPQASCLTERGGRLCTSTAYRCERGFCLKDEKTDVGQCDNAQGKCIEPTQCTTLCDCAQGQYCVEGRCFKSSFPGFCCETPGCPAGETCYDSRHQSGKCPYLCSSPCDCPEGYDCVNGKCSRGPVPVYCCEKLQQCPSGATCKSRTNQASTCPSASRPCQGACDCVQGEACIGGQCVLSAAPRFCCDKEGCPDGQGCENQNQQSGFCPTPCVSLCDCPQGRTCIQGRCNQDPGLGGGYCCSKEGCPQGQFCYNANGQIDYCPTRNCSSPCDCAQGEDCQNNQCTATSPPVYCCSKPGCPQGQNCRSANNQWGSCGAGQAPCQSPCDCEQGEDCYRGQCVGSFPPVYCCTKVGCPQGQACFNAQNAPSLCPTSSCKSACDCPHQGQSCVRGRCTIITGSARVYCCDKPFCPPGNLCEDKLANLKLCSQQACQTPCDCNQGEDCRNGVCTYTSPPILCCNKPFCYQGAACVRPDGTASTCSSNPFP